MSEYSIDYKAEYETAKQHYTAIRNLLGRCADRLSKTAYSAITQKEAISKLPIESKAEQLDELTDELIKEINSVVNEKNDWHKSSMHWFKV